MALHQGRSPRGKRLVDAAPVGHWKTSTRVAGLRLDGMVAPLVIAHAMNGVTVRAAAPRDVDTLCETIGESLGRLSSANCANSIACSNDPRMTCNGSSSLVVRQR